jgi:hypothetical protein
MISISFATFLLITYLLNSSIAAESPKKFMFAYGAIGGHAMSLWIAKEQGIFVSTILIRS